MQTSVWFECVLQTWPLSRHHISQPCPFHGPATHTILM